MTDVCENANDSVTVLLVVKVQNYRWGNAIFRFGPLTMVMCLSLAL